MEYSLPVIDTRGHIDYPLFGEPRLNDDFMADEYEIEGVIPAGDSLVVTVHGYMQNPDRAIEFGEEVSAGLSRHGVQAPVTAFSWDSDGVDTAWPEAVLAATKVAPKLAAFIESWASQRDDPTVAIVAHSLGARVTLEAIRLLDDETNITVDNVVLFGAAVDADELATAYRHPIRRTVDRFDNFWTPRDSVLRMAYGAAESTEALGLSGAMIPDEYDARLPSNVFDHRVGYVSTHFDYYDPDPDAGCLDDVVRAWSEGYVSQSVSSFGTLIDVALSPLNIPMQIPVLPSMWDVGDLETSDHPD